jgi:hypothetical protein
MEIKESKNEEFISITNIAKTYIDEPLLNEDECHNELLGKGEFVYQIQGQTDNSSAQIMNVGILLQLHDVLINEFDLSPKIRCVIVNCIYNQTLLKQLENNCRFPIIKTLISYNNGVTSIPLANMSYHFNTFVHQQNNQSIVNYLSSQDHKINLYGFFSINFQLENKIMNLEIYKNHLSHSQIFENLIYWVKDEQILKLLNQRIDKMIK